MPNQSGPTTEAGRAASSKNAMRHGLTNLHPVVTEADRPEFKALRAQLFYAIQPVGFLQELAVERLVNNAWNMQRQRFAKRNGRPAPTAPVAAENPQPQSNQQGAKRNPVPCPNVGRNSPCPCGSGRKYKRCCGPNAAPILYAA